MSDDFVIRLQLRDRETDQVFDWFDLEIPENVYGVNSSKKETPFLVAQTFFSNIKRRIKR